MSGMVAMPSEVMQWLVQAGMDISHHGGAAYHDEAALMDGNMSTNGLTKYSPNGMDSEVRYNRTRNADIVSQDRVMGCPQRPIGGGGEDTSEIQSGSCERIGCDAGGDSEG